MITPSLVTSQQSTYNSRSQKVGAEAAPGSIREGGGSDVVEFSTSALAAAGGEKLSAANPAIFSNEVQLKGNLARILMETLFGKEETNAKSPEEELVQAMVEEPAAEQILDKLIE
jgi:hypothetical protein